MVSNQSFGAWGDVFGDRVIATAILDRVLHHAITLNIRGNSYRLKRSSKPAWCVPRRRRLNHGGGVNFQCPKRVKIGCSLTAGGASLFGQAGKHSPGSTGTTSAPPIVAAAVTASLDSGVACCCGAETRGGRGAHRRARAHGPYLLGDHRGAATGRACQARGEAGLIASASLQRRAEGGAERMLRPAGRGRQGQHRRTPT